VAVYQIGLREKEELAIKAVTKSMKRRYLMTMNEAMIETQARRSLLASFQNEFQYRHMARLLEGFKLYMVYKKNREE